MATWYGFYQDLLRKAIELRNKNANKKLDPYAVSPQLLPMSDRQWKRLEKFWLPAARYGIVSKELFLEQIPDIDAEEELQRHLGGDLQARSSRKIGEEFGKDVYDSLSRRSETDVE
jgi:hypothetical protein